MNDEPLFLVPPPDAADRARAAINFAGLKLPKVSEKTGLEIDLLRNITSATRASGGTLDRLFVIADACRVPQAFMKHGFPPAVGSEWLSGQVSEIARELHDAIERIAELEATIQRLT